MYLPYERWRWIWSFGQSLEGKRRKEKNSGFLHHAQISSKVRCRFFHGLIELKFGGEVHKSLILNLNGDDRILSFGKSFFSKKQNLYFIKDGAS